VSGESRVALFVISEFTFPPLQHSAGGNEVRRNVRLPALRHSDGQPADRLRQRCHRAGGGSEKGLYDVVVAGATGATDGHLLITAGIERYPTFSDLHHDSTVAQGVGGASLERCATQRWISWGVDQPRSAIDHPKETSTIGGRTSNHILIVSQTMR
jgi:hypothetical protein